MGTIYKCHTELPLSKLGLDQCRVRKLNLDLNASVEYSFYSIRDKDHKYK